MSDKVKEDKEELSEDRTDWAEDRTLMANERTFAGWMRTGLASVGVGLAVEAIFREASPTWIAKSVSTVFICIGVFIFIAAYRGSARVLSRLDSHAARPMGGNALKWVVAFFAIGAVFLNIVLWLLL